MNDCPPRSAWTYDEVLELYRLPLLELVTRAADVHRIWHSYAEIQCCSLLSVKTGGCPEDCAYCPQSARYSTDLAVQKLMPVDDVIAAANSARSAGASRFCMGAAWRDVRDNSDFDRVLEMVDGVRALGMEVCCTLGMLTADQARRLADHGLTAYNHNLDCSAEFYDEIISTRTYEERMETIRNVRDAGLSLCCGGIIGMGETERDRVDFIRTLASLDPYPESVPINALVPVEGTPLGDRPPVDPFEFVRMIACARITMPKAKVRLSAGRQQMSDEAQALAFLAGANSIFIGETLLTTPNPSEHEDRRLMQRLGITESQPFTAEFTITVDEEE